MQPFLLSPCLVKRFTFMPGQLLPGREADVILMRCGFHATTKKKKNTLWEDSDQQRSESDRPKTNRMS